MFLPRDVSIHHLPADGSRCSHDLAPQPDAAPAKWKAGFACAMGEDAFAKGGKQLLRITNDMVVICDEDEHRVSQLRVHPRDRAF